MSEPAFIRAQRAFARHVRDPEHVPAPAGLPEARLAVYRYAVYHNIERFMADNFPRIKGVMPPDRWQALVRDYLVRHPATTPVFARLPAEFLAYLEHARSDPEDPPFLHELAHFDWLENFVGTDEREIVLDGIDRDGDLLTGTIIVNPIHIVQTYRYPVHAISADFTPADPPARATHLVAFRDCADHYGVIDLNAVSRQLFLAVRDTPARNARQILADMARQLGQSNVSAVVQGGLDILTRMRRQGLILGTRAG